MLIFSTHNATQLITDQYWLIVTRRTYMVWDETYIVANGIDVESLAKLAMAPSN
jgi:hypothetical protein